jgi:hypothetical protein
MAISTQLRLIQVTGSLGSGVGQINDSLSAGASSTIAAADVSGLLSNMASSLLRLHGAASFSENATGQMLHTSQVLLSSSQAATDAVKLESSHVNGGVRAKGYAVHLTGSVLDLDAGAFGIDMDAAGAIALDSQAAISLDSAAASNFSVVGADLTLATATSGDMYASSAGSIDIQAASVVSVDAAGGTVYLGNDLDSAIDIKSTGIGYFKADLQLNLETTGSSSSIIVSASNQVLVDAVGGMVIGSDGTLASYYVSSQGTWDVDAVGAATVDAVGASNFSTTSGDLTFQTSTSGDIYAQAAGSVYGTGATGALLSATANNAEVQALSGSVNLSGSDYVNIDAGPSGRLDAGTITPLAGVTLNASGGDITAISVTFDVNATGLVSMDGSALTIGGAGGTGAITIDSTAGFDLDSAAASHLRTSAGDMDIQGVSRLALSASAGAVALSGSSGVAFAADAGFAFGKDANGGVLVMDAASEASTYRSNFSSTTSILAAINSLYSSISSTEATLFKNVLSSAVAAGTGITLTKVAGDAASFSASVAPNKLDVYANGQLLISGSEAQRAAGSADYAVSGATQLKLAFDAAIDDALVAIDRS